LTKLIIFTSSLACFRIAVVIIIKNICNFALVSTLAFALDFVLARDRARDRVLAFVFVSTSVSARLFARVSASVSSFVSKVEMSLLSFEIKQLKIDEDENYEEEENENEKNDVCNNSRIVVKSTLQFDEKVV
jgi:hypothetical protein